MYTASHKHSRLQLVAKAFFFFGKKKNSSISKMYAGMEKTEKVLDWPTSIQTTVLDWPTSIQTTVLDWPTSIETTVLDWPTSIQTTVLDRPTTEANGYIFRTGGSLSDLSRKAGAMPEPILANVAHQVCGPSRSLFAPGQVYSAQIKSKSVIWLVRRF
jgi:hypothetical protein